MNQLDRSASGLVRTVNIPMPLLYPLRFTPIYQYRLWGGRRLANWLSTPLPTRGPIGEAWLLSDRDDYSSTVAEGPLRGYTITQLMEQSPQLLLGTLSRRFKRFPLLLKFLDVQKMLSVQVHPSDDDTNLIPEGENGKTEAWIVLEAAPGSRVYAGLRSGVTAETLRTLSNETINENLASLTPQRGQGILIEAGVVHSLGNGVSVFEIQENSDVTFRLYDWNHIDPRTGETRPLQIEQAIACVDLTQGAILPSVPAVDDANPGQREELFDDPHFRVWRFQSAASFAVGTVDEMRVLVCLGGAGTLDHDGNEYKMERGAVILVPAVVGACRFRPERHVTLLEIAVPDHS
jgi:mannose-6-phosphate isomerase